MRIMVLGGDGFCGWATSLHLSDQGAEVTIVDNFARRDAETELGAESLTPIVPLDERLDAWHAVSGHSIGFRQIDVARDPQGLRDAIVEIEPTAIVHFAEQRAAPYSMRSPDHKRYTVDNNVSASHNLLSILAEVAPATHLVHLGTMGVYGYGANGKPFQIPEGYVSATLRSGNHVFEKEIMYPPDPGSVYHMTKTLDALLFYFYAKNDSLRITDLHQGIVWGTTTDQTERDERLVNRFDYDGDYGTVLNRFLMQAAVGHPLTVHGTGGQTRAFIHIRDTVRCIELAIDNPPATGDRVNIMNQLTETHRVRDLAELVSRLTGAEIQYLDNPRKEKAENNLLAANANLRNLGLDPTHLSEGLLHEVIAIAEKYADRCQFSRMASTAKW